MVTFWGNYEGISQRLAGIDVLLTTSLTPYVIEINGQGDLIYQDAQQNNLIYQAQIRAMRKQNV
ncbi:hypothetical protein DB649_23595 [Salmonella enterica]|nr:hypothetical protein [Salmonella enterica]